MENLDWQKEYELFYTSSENGRVQVHATHNGPEREDNEKIARFLADRGETVVLLPIGDEPGVKNPDAAIEGAVWEFKTNRVGTANSVNNEIRRAHRQANQVLLWLVAKMDLRHLQNAIYNRVRQCPNLTKCRFIISKKLYEFNREEIVSQDFRGRIVEKEKEDPA